MLRENLAPPFPIQPIEYSKPAELTYPQGKDSELQKRRKKKEREKEKPSKIPSALKRGALVHENVFP